MSWLFSHWSLGPKSGGGKSQGELDGSKLRAWKMEKAEKLWKKRSVKGTRRVFWTAIA